MRSNCECETGTCLDSSSRCKAATERMPFSAINSLMRSRTRVWIAGAVAGRADGGSGACSGMVYLVGERRYHTANDDFLHFLNIFAILCKNSSCHACFWIFCVAYFSLVSKQAFAIYKNRNNPILDTGHIVKTTLQNQLNQALRSSVAALASARNVLAALHQHLLHPLHTAPGLYPMVLHRVLRPATYPGTPKLIRGHCPAPISAY